MGNVKTYLLAALLALASVELVGAAATKFTNVEVTGTLLVDGASTLTGAVTQTGANTFAKTTTHSLGLNSSTGTFTTGLTVTGASGIANTYGVTSGTAALTNSTMAVTVSSATTSGDKLCVGGAFASLPTTGFNRGCLVVDTADQKLYISTETVVGTQSWKSVGSQ